MKRHPMVSRHLTPLRCLDAYIKRRKIVLWNFDRSSCSINPYFCCDEVNSESNPKRGAKKIFWRQSRKRTCGKKDPDNRSGSSYSHTKSISTDHPLPVHYDIGISYRYKCLHQRKQKQSPKQSGGRCLAYSADRHFKSH